MGLAQWKVLSTSSWPDGFSKAGSATVLIHWTHSLTPKDALAYGSLDALKDLIKPGGEEKKRKRNMLEISSTQKEEEERKENEINRAKEKGNIARDI
jgi:hypothetical protein